MKTLLRSVFLNNFSQELNEISVAYIIYFINVFLKRTNLFVIVYLSLVTCTFSEKHRYIL